jgi:branched-chain amino acid transport system permease protein
LLLILLPEFLRLLGLPNGDAAQIRQAIYGLCLIVLMLYRPKGLLGEYEMK